MILLCGIPSESPLSMVCRRLETAGDEYVIFNQREVDNVDFTLEVTAGRITGTLAIRNQKYPLELFDGVYLRLMDEQLLPELELEERESARRMHSRRVHEALLAWADITPSRVVNRPAAMGSNASKPYQAQLIRDCGFEVPETIITNDPEVVRQYRTEYGRMIYKSMSGVRSIVRLLEQDSDVALEAIRWCPVQFQRYVEGIDVRVHTVGTSVFATTIESDADDYRYSAQQTGHAAVLRRYDLPDHIAKRCVGLAADLGLAVAGLDFRLTPDGTYVCFEANPCPVFSYYEGSTGQPISAAIADYLAHRIAEGQPTQVLEGSPPV
jgi:glutathione synthase/RimK-type ligase-like ATP-grasp enzyme